MFTIGLGYFHMNKNGSKQRDKSEIAITKMCICAPWRTNICLLSYKVGAAGVRGAALVMILCLFKIKVWFPDRILVTTTVIPLVMF